MMQYFIICPLIFLSGFVDAVAGGGGLIALPAYLIAGIPAHSAIGTNKLSASMGTTVSLIRFAKDGFIPWKLGFFCLAGSLSGAAVGANLAMLIDDRYFKYILLVVLPLTAAYVLFSKKLFAQDKPAYPFVKTALICVCCAFVMGVYDGFYGPGAGTFLLLAFVSIGHMSLEDSAGLTKLLNLSSNLCSLVVYAANGRFLPLTGFIAGLFGIAGHYLGARSFEKGGTRSVKPIILFVLALFLIKLILEFFGISF